jgi:hypothetical protein
MRNSSVKTTYLRSGTYSLGSEILLTNADNGETWQQYPGDLINSAIVDGAGLIQCGFDLQGASNVLIDSFTLRNFIRIGVNIHGGLGYAGSILNSATVAAAANNTVSNMEIYNLATPNDSNRFDTGFVEAGGNVPNLTIANNYFHDCNSQGINVANSNDVLSHPRPGDTIGGLRIINNIVANASQVVTDTGAIYVQDLSHTDTNLLISQNYIVFGAVTVDAHGIYLDQATSNMVVTSNIVWGGSQGGNDVNCCFVSCGKNNHIYNNVFDVGSSAKMMAAVVISNPTGPITDMSNNIIERNLVIFRFAGSQQTSAFTYTGFTYVVTGAVAQAVFTNSDYFNFQGGAALSTGPNNNSDSSPLFINPGFSASDHTFQVPLGNALLSAPLNWVNINLSWGPVGRWPVGTFPWLP